MHQTFFGVKRVHLLNLRFSRLLLREFWLFHAVTPARFDMLRIVHVHDVEGVSVAQANIRELLGVSGATVSRMLKALEGLGYIVRERKKWRPGLHVRLTATGRELVKRLMARFIEDEGASIDVELDELVEAEPDALRAFDEILLFFRNAYEDRLAFPTRGDAGGSTWNGIPTGASARECGARRRPWRRRRHGHSHAARSDAPGATWGPSWELGTRP